MALYDSTPPREVTTFLNLFFLVLFIPLLLYAVYQSVNLFTRASLEKIQITIIADKFLPQPTSIAPTQTGQQKLNKTQNSSSISQLLPQIIGNKLEISGVPEDFVGFAEKNNNTITLYLANTRTTQSRTEIIPLTVQHMKDGDYTSRIIYANEQSCAKNDPPLTQPERKLHIAGGTITNTVCLPPNNALVWTISQ